ncbi:MAG: YifB family Mg chelatase-like AAA ATPase [Nocardioides sp.]
MPVATARAVSLQGTVGHLIEVQVDLSPGTVKTVLVGRPDAALNEARDRCRMAIANSWVDERLEWPATRRITILLSPSDLPKRGTHFDLAIAISVLAAADQVPAESLGHAVFVGELTLTGGLRSVPGVLPMAMTAASHGYSRIFVPEPQANEAALVPGLEVLGMRSLSQVVAELRGVAVPEAAPVAPVSGNPLLAWRGQDRSADLDFVDVFGVADARFAIEVAAAGGHHLQLSGPKGSGKTTLAERIPSILPDLTSEEALELAAIGSLAGVVEVETGVLPGLSQRPPFFAPHHSASRTSLLGGGAGRVRPGEISRAHAGVLFLDEFPLFGADVIEALRQPLESGEVTIARGEESATFPARGLVVLAANPCPCGDFHPYARENRCVCPETRRRDYRRRITGPLADRIDITRHVLPVQPHEMSDPLAAPEPSARIRARVELARARQAERYAGRSWRLNGQAPGPSLRSEWPLAAEVQALLDEQLYAGRLSRRGATRVHRLAWTVADLAGLARPGPEELGTAIRLRTGEPLSHRSLDREVLG